MLDATGCKLKATLSQDNNCKRQQDCRLFLEALAREAGLQRSRAIPDDKSEYPRWYSI